jgi:hypothetical protein
VFPAFFLSSRLVAHAIAPGHSRPPCASS